MEPTHLALTVLACIVAAIIFFSIFKGVIRMILLAIAVISAIVVWMFIQRSGFTFLSFLTANPQPWMVQTAAWGLSIFVFMVFFHGMSWFSQLFSWRRGGASTCGIITNILMSCLMIWIATLGISYYGNISLISHYQSLAESYMNKKPSPEMPWFTRMKFLLRKADSTGWLEKIDPMDDPAQAYLACLVAFGCSLDETQYTAFYNERLANCGIPQPTRFLDLFRDKGLRTLVAEKRFVTLLENERLKTFLQFRDTEDHMLRILRGTTASPH
ncbi:MAG: hypothetical protein IJB31_04065 [Akkermansia sp.]|nr:hypothetical protein [Akkermansia sp.]